VVGRALAVARIDTNVVRSHNAHSTEGVFEHERVTGQSETLKRFAWRAREREEPIPFAAIFGDVIEEGAKLRAAFFRCDIGDGLNYTF